MLIGIDASPASKEHKTGIEWYCHHVINELTALDTENEYRLYSKTPVRSSFARAGQNVSEIVLPDRAYWTHTALASEVRRSPVDVFYSPGHIIPWSHPRRTVSTIHDAGFRHYRKSYSAYQFLHATVNSWTSARWSSDIIVPSQFVADDIATVYNLRHKRVRVAPNGFDMADFNGIGEEEIAAARRQHGVIGQYFIFVGRMDVRKNILRALQAFGAMVDAGGAPMQFVLVGAPGIGFADVEAFLAAQPPGRVIRTGYVDIATKAALMAGARALIFPSLYEGFGIPILEGFGAGVPVLTSNITSCPEIAGDAALLVDPLDAAAIRHGMERLQRDDELCRNLVERGRARAGLYSWTRTAREVHHVLTSAS